VPSGVRNSTIGDTRVGTNGYRSDTRVGTNGYHSNTRVGTNLYHRYTHVGIMGISKALLHCPAIDRNSDDLAVAAVSVT